jgi:hypothetical protein
MQRGLYEVVGVRESQRLLMGLVDYIHAREGEYRHGCPVLLLYPYAKSRGLPGSWIMAALRLLCSRGVTGENFGHYRVFAYDRIKEKATLL